MADVAARAGVSLKTVSRVVNNAPHVQPELVERVLAAVAELGFRRNPQASSLRSGQPSATIGLLIEEIANPFYATIAGVVAEIARQNDTMLIIASSEEDPDREQQLLREMCTRRVDGLLVVPAGDDHAFLRAEIELGTPMVFLDRPAGGLIADTVLLDNRGGARDGMRRLLEAGHRRIGILLDSLGVYTMRERLDGAQDALAPAGVPYDTRLVRDGIRGPSAAARVVSEMLDRPDAPTAFFSLNNRITLGVIEELHRRGSDAALLGFDDFDMAGLVPYPLTVIAYDTRELARAAAELLFRRIEGDRSWPRTVVLPTELVARGLAPR
ncbi:LacI family transcriptional regulator [Planotetraspora thailandica]|uniref:LacI family transcriptional regulator n=2 Tax=Planotetraspora thailandica TaxID=487172 RepID=A0A8J3XWY8_9ACTN|nr:LacI family transcriptional regulator [Planotetraspora thailandica]